MSVVLSPRIEEWLKEGVRRGASDLLLIPGEPPVWRMPDGLERAELPPLTAGEIREMAAQAFGEDTLGRIGRDTGHITRSCNAPTLCGRACLCAAKAQGEITLTLMLVPPQIADVQSIAAPKPLLDAVSAKGGLVVISGPVGSGKTTTAHSLVNYINLNFPRHICTVEEPVYVQLPRGKALVQQREVGLDVPDPIAGIQAAIKQDPDVLFVSELYGAEELLCCLSAAELGPLVIVLFNQPTPEAAIRRMLDVFPEDIRAAACRTLARVLRAVSAQRLFPHPEGKGRRAAYGVYIPDGALRQWIMEAGMDAAPGPMPRPDGSQTLSAAIRQLAAEKKISHEAMTDALKELQEE